MKKSILLAAVTGALAILAVPATSWADHHHHHHHHSHHDECYEHHHHDYHHDFHHGYYHHYREFGYGWGAPYYYRHHYWERRYYHHYRPYSGISIYTPHFGLSIGSGYGPALRYGYGYHGFCW